MTRTIHDEKTLFYTDEENPIEHVDKMFEELLEAYKHAPNLPWKFVDNISFAQSVSEHFVVQDRKYIVGSDEDGNEKLLGQFIAYSGFEEKNEHAQETADAMFAYTESAVHAAITGVLMSHEYLLMVGSVLDTAKQTSEGSLAALENVTSTFEKVQGVFVTKKDVDRMKQNQQEIKISLDELDQLTQELKVSLAKSAFIDLWFERTQLIKLTRRYRSLMFDLERFITRKGPTETTFHTHAYDNICRKLYDEFVTPMENLPSWLDFREKGGEKDET